MNKSTDAVNFNSQIISFDNNMDVVDDMEIINLHDDSEQNNNNNNSGIEIEVNSDLDLCALASYGEFSTKHLNCLSISNPFGALNIIGDSSFHGVTTMSSDLNLLGSNMTSSNVNIQFNDSDINVNGCSQFNIGSSSGLNVMGRSDLNDLVVKGHLKSGDVLICGNLIVLGDTTHAVKNTVDKNLTINEDMSLLNNSSKNHLIFGKENAEGSWRITVINGLMHIQKYDGNMWITKSTIG